MGVRTRTPVAPVVLHEDFFGVRGGDEHRLGFARFDFGCPHQFRKLRMREETSDTAYEAPMPLACAVAHAT
jgi:hypothetical protein